MSEGSANIGNAKNNVPPLIPVETGSVTDLQRLFIDVTQKFNDRTVNTLRLIGGFIFVVATVLSGFSIYNMNAEKDRIERALNNQDEKFSSLAAELKGIYSGAPEVEIISTVDKKPIDGRIFETKIRRANHLNDKPYRINIPYTIRNIGKGSTGPIWIKIYLEPSDLFAGESNPDEPGYGVQVNLPSSSWSGPYKDINASFPGAGFSTNLESNIELLKNSLPKGKYKVLLKVYYGSDYTRVVQAQGYFELASDWIRPKEE